MNLCECGCGKLTRRRFISGHNRRGDHKSVRGSGWHHSDKAKLNISNGQKANKELIENRRNIAKRMGLAHGGKNLDGCRKGGLACVRNRFENNSGDGIFYNTSPEIQMKKCLTENGVIGISLEEWKTGKYEGRNIFIHQYPVKNIKHCYLSDFYLPLYNLIIEVDGKDIHNFPNVIQKDLLRTRELEEANYRVLRFLEGEFDTRSVWREI